MSSKPKLLFVFDHKYPDRWMDGLWAALNLLEDDFEIDRFNLQVSDTNDYPNEHDFVLGWGAFGSRVDQALQPVRSIKKGLCIAGNAMPPTGADNYDVLFYETKWYRPQINFHKNIVHAFGINSDIYNSEPVSNLVNMSFATPVVWDYIGVGSLSAWKRWDKILGKNGLKLVVGEYQVGNETESLSIAQNLVKNGCMVSNMVNPVDLANLYRWSRVCYIPADINGGGERAVLEARACGLKVEVEFDNPKLLELLTCPIYDEKYYAAQLKKGVLSCL